MKPQHICCPPSRIYVRLLHILLQLFLMVQANLASYCFQPTLFEPQRSCLLPQSLALSRFSFARLVDLFEPRHAPSPLAHPPKPLPLCGLGESRLSWQPPFPLGGGLWRQQRDKRLSKKTQTSLFSIRGFFLAGRWYCRRFPNSNYFLPQKII